MRTNRKIATIITAATIALAPLVAASPANAASLTNVVASSSGLIGTTGTNATPITVQATIATAVAGDASQERWVEYKITLPTGWSFETPYSFASTCPSWLTATGINAELCGAVTISSGSFLSINSAAINANQVVTIVFAANSLNLGSGRDFTLETFEPGTLGAIDRGTATLPGGGSSGGGTNGSSTLPPAGAPSTTPEQSSGVAATLAKTGTENGSLAPAVAALLLLAAGGTVLLARRKRTS